MSTRPLLILVLALIGLLLAASSCEHRPDPIETTDEATETATAVPFITPFATPTSPPQRSSPTPEPRSTPTPAATATAAPVWNTVTDPVLGLTVQYPPGFFASTSSPALPFTIQNWDPNTVEWAHFPETGLRIEFAPAAMQVAGVDAAIYKVGIDSYPGSSEERYEDVWGTPSRITTIRYSAEGQDWLITGYLSEASPDEVQREEIFHAIVATVNHFPAAPEEQDPIPAEPILPRAYFSPEYLNPEASIRLAFEEFEHTSSLNNPWVQYQLERAHYIQLLYHPATGEPGSFNVDTTDFYPWLVNYISSRSIGGSDSEFYYQMREHAWNQVHTAIYEPQSEIGQRIRQLEAGLDPDFGGWGPEVYWTYLVGPYCEGANSSTPRTRDIPARIFNGLVSDYTMEQIRNPILEDFGAFLAAREYFADPLSCY
jgi:hypothetical protein